LEDPKISSFIEQGFEIQYVAEPEKAPTDNVLHRIVYSGLGELMVKFSPLETHFEILYEWSINSTKWMNVTAFLLGPYLENETLASSKIFEHGFALFKYGIHKKYWILNNDLNSCVVCWSDK